MPNHVAHKVIVCGDADELSAFEETCFDKVTEGWNEGSLYLNFDNILPIPKELEGICSGRITIDDVKVERWRNIDGKDVAITEEERKKLIENYGSDCLLDWCTENWGTKWNSYDYDCTYANSTNMEFGFSTAWSTPQPIFNKLIEMYPSLTFDVMCFDEGWSFAGVGAFSSKGNTFQFVDADADMYEQVYDYPPEMDEEEE